MQTRDNTIDTTKGLCMLIIMLIHTEAWVYIGLPCTFVAVPLFFFMSGFFDNSETKSWRNCVQKFIKAFIIPVIVWLFIGMMVLTILESLKTKSFTVGLLDFGINNPTATNGPAWFLIALLYAKIMTKAIYEFCSKCSLSVAYFLPICLLLGYTGSTFQLPLHFDEGCAALPFYMLGKMLFQYKNQWGNNLIIRIISLASFLILSFSYITFTIGPIGNCMYKPNYIIAFIAILLSFPITFYAARGLSKVSFLSQIGTNAMGIMLIHLPLSVIFARIAWRIAERGTVEWFMVSAVFYLIILMVSYLISKLVIRYYPFLLGK